MKRKNWYLTVGTALTAAMIAWIVLGFFWTPYDPSARSAADKYAPPSLTHPFGCDHMGRDIFSRTLEGAGTTLTIAAAVLVIGFVFGLLIGALCGYYGGAADALVMRLCDAVSAFPSILLALAAIALLGRGKHNMIAALGVLFVPSFARLVRGEYLKQRDLDYVKSAKLMGVSDARIIFVHILPNVWPVLLSGLTIGFNNAVLAEASMSYLGVGVSPTEPSLGYMLSESQAHLMKAPWFAAFPALVIILLILGVGLAGEGVRGELGAAS